MLNRRFLKNKLYSFISLPFRLRISKFLNIYLAYHPDSYVSFNAYPEFDELFNKFIRDNAKNNAGDIARLWSFILNCRQIIDENIEGNFAELGVWRGNTAAVLAHYAKETGRKVYLFDTYSGFDPRDLKNIDKNESPIFEDTSIDLVKGVIATDADACMYIKGYFPDSLTKQHELEKFAVVSLDCDLYEPMRAGLTFFYPRMTHGGIFFLHDYSSLHWAGAKKAINEFCIEHGEHLILMPDKSGSAFMRKTKGN